MEDIPPELMNEYRDVHLDIDIIFVNGIAFLTVVPQHLRMTNTRVILNHKHNTMKDAITAIKSKYEKRGFKVKTMHSVNEFAPLELVEWRRDDTGNI